MILDWFQSFQRIGKLGSLWAARRRRRRLIALISESGLFDAAWYLESYADVRNSGVDPARHYLEAGWREGRDPGPSFCTTSYLKANSDVAASGVNPLVHFLENGHAEGRAAAHPSAPLRPVVDPIEKFGPAAPCVRFEFRLVGAVSWNRASRIRAGSETFALASGITVANARGDQREILAEALSRLAWLSGRAAVPEGSAPTRAGTCAELRDAWHAGQGLLRTRWRVRAGKPLVVRALQHLDAEPQLVAEGSISDDLDLIDLKLVSSYFPILFLFTDSDGDLLGISHLSFPTLCRGNLHYPELVALSQHQAGRQPTDIASIDEQLANRLIALRKGEDLPLVGALIVGLEAADGSSPLFQSDCQAWLSRVMAVSMRPAPASAGRDSNFLAAAVRAPAVTSRPAGAASLIIPSESIPAISALSATGTVPGDSDEISGPVIVTGEQGESVWTCVHLPPNSPEADASINVPRLERLRTVRKPASSVPLLAIQLPTRLQIQDAELLAPQSLTRRDQEDRSRKITWLIQPAGWNEASLLQSLLALAEQVLSVSSVLFVGEASLATANLARRLFDGRVHSELEIGAATKHLAGDLCGYLGPEIILHDRNTVSRLAPLLDNDSILTATALVVFAERRGRGLFVAAADGLHVQPARLLPDTVVPITGASNDFWLARAGSVRPLLASSSHEDGNRRHVCATFLSVSRLAAEPSSDPAIELPRTPVGQAISTELVVG